MEGEARDVAQTKHIEHPRGEVSYRFTLVTMSGLVAFLFFFAMLVLKRQAIGTLPQGALGSSLHLTRENFALLAELSILPIGAAITTYFLARITISVLRLGIYLRALHGYADAYLHQHAPLQTRYNAPRVVPVDSTGQPHADGEATIRELTAGGASTLLLGSSGSGKSTALYSLASAYSRKRTLWRVYRGKAPLPVLLPLTGYAEMPATGTALRLAYCVAQVKLFGTAGLAARLPWFLRHRRVLLLCDGLDDVALDERASIATELAMFSQQAGWRAQVIVTYDLDAYLDTPRPLGVLHDFQRLLLVDLSAAEISRALHHTMRKVEKISTAGVEPTAQLVAHRLDTAVRTPAYLAHLIEVLQSGAAMPFGRGELLSATCKLLARRLLGDEMQPERLLLILAYLAAALHTNGQAEIPIHQGEHMGAALWRFLTQHQPLSPVEYAVTPSLALTPEDAETVCAWALQGGLLLRRLDGAALYFSSKLLAASLAARYLDLCDDGLGRLNPELLRPRWILPLLLRSGTVNEAADLAARLQRLIETPDTTGARAGISRREEASWSVLALTLAMLVEGAAVAWARAAASPRHEEQVEEQAIALRAQSYLRDLIDRIHMVTTNATHRHLLAHALRKVVAHGGEEVIAHLEYLTGISALDRLVRAQLIDALGLLATPPALSALVRLLAETDPTLRQAVDQSFFLAGATALPILRQQLTNPDERIRLRAEGIFVQFGAQAEVTALAALAGTDAPARLAAIQVLGTMKATSAISQLAALLDDRDPEVVSAAIDALGNIGGKQAFSALLPLLQADEHGRRAAVARALGLTRQLEAIPHLLALLEDADADVRAAAATGLGMLGDARARTLLQAHAADPDTQVQHAAMAALRRLTAL